MGKRNKESEEKKWNILYAWNHRNDKKTKQPIFTSGIYLRDTSYSIADSGCKYGYPGGWSAMMKDIDADRAGRSILPVGPVEFWKVQKPYVRTIEGTKKSWPIYTIENGKFVDHVWPQKAKVQVNRHKNRK